MDYACELIEREAEPVLSVRTRAAVDQLPQVMGRIYGEIMTLLDKRRGYPSGPPFAAYYNMDMQDLDLEIGIPVASPQEGVGDIRPGRIPAGRFASCMYIGPYDRISAGYETLTAWMEDQGLEPGGIAYELYLNDPASTPPGELQTQLLFLMKD
jgi:effector-binding domain-containing protein